MRMYDVIVKKRDGKELTTEEIKFFVEGYTKGEIKDYQASALIMAIFLKGMNKRETIDLTTFMMNSGDTIDLSDIKGVKVDKHSTGGVGDTTTMVLAPLVAACNVPVAKMSGRGLGHTGGTLDKLEAIKDFSIQLPIEKFIENVNKHQIAVVGQTKDIAPADKKLYALRDVTGTVDNISLIAASIMSKKLAAGSDAIVLDVKTGSGAFIKDYQGAVELGNEMVEIGEGMNRDVIAIVTSMEQPLGFAIGNSLEVKEAIDTLKGEGPEDLTELCIALGANMILLGGAVDSYEAGRKMIQEKIESGEGLQKFVELVDAQGGDSKVILNPELLPQASIVKPYYAKSSGYIKSMQSEEIGIASMILGAGRSSIEDEIDLSAGIMIDKKVGDYIEEGQEMAVLYTNDESKIADAEKRLDGAFEYSDSKVEPIALVKAMVTKDGVIKY